MLWRAELKHGATHVDVSGAITEQDDLTEILAKIDSASSQVVFDLAGIQRINSIGVREWINLMSALNRAGKQVTFSRCSVCVVHHLHIPSFRGSSVVSSVMAPYFCDPCDKIQSVLLQARDLSGELPRQLPCPTCGAAMEFDEMPDTYLPVIIPSPEARPPIPPT